MNPSKQEKKTEFDQLVLTNVKQTKNMRCDRTEEKRTRLFFAKALQAILRLVPRASLLPARIEFARLAERDGLLELLHLLSNALHTNSLVVVVYVLRERDCDRLEITVATANVPEHKPGKVVEVEITRGVLEPACEDIDLLPEA